VAIIVIVITSAASDFGRLVIYERYDGMVGDAAALNAVIVDDVPETEIGHRKIRRPVASITNLISFAAPANRLSAVRPARAI